VDLRRKAEVTMGRETEEEIENEKKTGRKR
jgi:hypothetical protein